MSTFRALLAAGVAALCLSFSAATGVAQTSPEDPVLCRGDVSAGAAVFRHKVGIKAIDCADDEDDNGGGDEDDDEGGGDDDGDDDGEDDEDSGGGVARADYRYDPDTLGIWGSAPQPLTVVPTDKNIEPDANGVTWQCFKAEGGHGNYFWILDNDPDGDDSWIEAFDVVVRSDLNKPIPHSPYQWSYTAPAYEADQSRFGIDSAGEVCVRVKADPEASGGNLAYLSLNLEDMSPGHLVGGFMPDYNFYGASSYGSLEVTACYDECPPIQFAITGPATYSFVAGDDAWFPWSTVYGNAPIEWSITGGPNTMAVVRHEMGGHFLRSNETGTFPVTLHATDDLGQTAELAVTIDVTEPPPLQITGPTELDIQIGLWSNPWQAEGGAGDYTWEVLGPPVLRFEQGYWNWDFRATQVGTYGDDPDDKVFIVVRDGGGDEQMLEVVVNVTRPNPGLVGWGSNSQHELALGYSQNTVYSPQESSYDKTFTRVAGGYFVTCGIADSDLYCWSNAGGRIGLGAGVSQQGPVDPITPEGGWTWVDASFGNASSICGIRSGSLYCWGGNDYYQLGIGNTTAQVYTPALVSSGGWSRVSPGARFTCGIRNGDMYCWGNNQQGVGDGTTNPVSTPVQVGPSGGWTEVDSGQGHACGIRNGDMYCWGYGSSALGRGVNSISGATVPEQITNDPGGWTKVAVGSGHSCGIRGGGELRCWGGNSNGQLGDGTTDGRNVASHAVQPGGFTDIAAGDSHTCAIRTGGEAYCWGEGWRGALGHGEGNDRNVPVRVGYEWDFDIIAAGATHTIAMGQRNGYEEPEVPEEPYDPGRPCGTGGSGNPVCEDDSPPPGDPIYHGHVPLYFSSNAIYYHRQFSAPWKGQHSVQVTAWSSQSVTNTGMAFAYVCWRPQGGGTIWQYGSNTNTLRSIVPSWIVRHDVVPRRNLFDGDVLLQHPDNTINAAYYPWSGEHDVVGSPTNYWTTTTTERDMCSRLVVDEADPDGDIWASVSPAALAFETVDGDRHGDYMMIITSVWITPGAKID